MISISTSRQISANKLNRMARRSRGMAAIETIMVLPFFILIFLGLFRWQRVVEQRFHTQVASYHAGMRELAGKRITDTEESAKNLRHWPCETRAIRRGEFGDISWSDLVGGVSIAVRTSEAIGPLLQNLSGAIRKSPLATAMILLKYFSACQNIEAEVMTQHADSASWPMASLDERRTFTIDAGDWSFENVEHPPGVLISLVLIPLF